MRRGFTLLETIFASVLMGFVILFICNLYPGSIVAIRRGETQIVADNLAQSILEDLRSRSFYNLTPINMPSYASRIYGGTEYTPSVSLTYDSDPSLESYLKIAKVRVNWKFQNRDQEVVQIMYLHNVTR
ncbi:MAG: type II secretion system protein [Candidatus Eremiobacteraeota bacterium]|nr:type II secretion system protein [Candidatus Eremiobacteraeota bacterium]